LSRPSIIAFLFVLLALAIIAPVEPVDPWGLFSPGKISLMIFVLAVLQFSGSQLRRAMGRRAGALLSGFFGGIISSTATTAALAKRSKDGGDGHTHETHLMFLAATAAMLIQSLALILAGTTGLHWELLLVLGLPMLLLAALIVKHARIKHQMAADSALSSEFRILPILLLAGFIALILALSQILQMVFGQRGLLVLTFIVSLFEVHGSLIANVQLHDVGTINAPLLANLVALSLLASMLSKLALVGVFGSETLKRAVFRTTLGMSLALLIGWSLAMTLLSST